MNPRSIPAPFIVASTALLLTHSALPQSVPGFVVTTYASVDNPNLLSFAPDGTLYAGRDTVITGSATPLKVHRIGPGGAPVVEYGDEPTPDPDTLVFDAAGVISGVPGSVLVGGLIPPAATSGRISAIRPNGSVVTIFESSQIDNPIEMKFDGDGRFLFTEGFGHSVWVSATGAMPTILFTYPGAANCAAYLAIDSSDRIFTCACDGIIRIHAADGTLIDNNFADVDGLAAIEFGPGGAFGTDLYALNRSTGTVYRVDGDGDATVFGTGFTGSPTELAVGPAPDVALYVSKFVADQVVRIAPCGGDGSGDLNGDGDVDGFDLATLLGAWGPCTGCCPADLNGSGSVNGFDLAMLLGAWS